MEARTEVFNFKDQVEGVKYLCPSLFFEISEKNDFWTSFIGNWSL